MSAQNIQQSYRNSALEGASQIGLVVVLYDRLVSDLRRAAASIVADNIEARCAELNHAGFVLGQLQDWINLESGDELAQNLVDFYGYLRAKMLQASITKSVPLLEELIGLVLGVRAAWQQRDAVRQVAAIPSGTSASGWLASEAQDHTAFSRDA